MKHEMKAEHRELWARVEELWRMSLTQDTEAISAALHPAYTGWVTGQPQPHDREFALRSVGPSSPRVLSYKLEPLGVGVFEGVTGVVHYRYVAEVRAGADAPKSVAGRWSEVYLWKDGKWLMISVSGGPDGER